MYQYFIIIVICFLFSCKKEVYRDLSNHRIQSVTIETIFTDSLASIRALEIFKKDGFVFATSTGKVGLGLNKDGTVKVNYVSQFKEDSIIPNFRSVAFNGKSVFALSIASPVLLYKDENLVYKETNDKLFYDSMQFWNENEGIAIGDPIDSCLSVIITRNAGDTWQKVPCADLPEIKNGEAAFAASNSNISIVDDQVWIATGGKYSRVLFSENKGETWSVYETPIIQGKATTGMYAIDFYDVQNGFAIGGDYTKPNDSTANKIKTINGGKTWELVGDQTPPGYRSCVQYVPNSNSKSIVAIGFKGIDVSPDSGETWKHLSDEPFYTVRFVNDSLAIAAGNGRIAKLYFNR